MGNVTNDENSTEGTSDTSGAAGAAGAAGADPETSGGKTIENERIYKKSFFFPFGTYNTDKQSIGRASEVLIGRYNERASFIRRLLNSGKGGAYLITGQRGAGKTSFVKHCMNAYEQDTVQRFTNSDLAKTWTDKIFSFVFIITLLLVPGFLATLIGYSEENALLYIFVGLPLVISIIGMLYLSYLPIKTAYYIREKVDHKSSDKKYPISKIKLKYLKAFFFAFIPTVVLVFSNLGISLAISGLLYLVSLYINATRISKDTQKPNTPINKNNHRNKITSQITGLSIYKTSLLFQYIFSVGCAFFAVELPFAFCGIATNTIEDSVVYQLTSSGVFHLVAFFLSLTIIAKAEFHFIVQPAQTIIQNHIPNKDTEKTLPTQFHASRQPETQQNTKPTKESLLKNYKHEKDKAAFKNYYRDLLKYSWIGAYIGVWKPILKIKINLGFDDMSHSNIVYGLLKQIERSYNNQFLNITTFRVQTTKSFVFVICFILAINIGDAIFAFKTRTTTALTQDTSVIRLTSPIFNQLFDFHLYQIQTTSKTTKNTYYLHTSKMNKPKNQSTSINQPNVNTSAIDQNNINLLVRMDSNEQKQVINIHNQWLYYLLYNTWVEIIPNKSHLQDSHYAFVLGWLLTPHIYPLREQTYHFDPSLDWAAKTDKTLPNWLKNDSAMLTNPLTAQYRIHSFHIIMLLIIFMCYFVIDYFIPILPYRSNIRRLRHVINRLTATQSANNNISVAAGISIPIPFTRNKVYQPLGSRDIEQHFLNILSSLNKNDNSVIGRLISVPTPDITIIFDELDKLGTSSKMTEEQQPSPTVKPNGTFEEVRSLKIKALLSDLKNVIDSQDCRFILIGGRHLRDEWLADQTKRDQLLPSIFDHAIYLPSLLTDSSDYAIKIHDNLLMNRIKEYINQQNVRAARLFLALKEENATPIVNMKSIKLREHQRFATQPLVNSRLALLRFSQEDEKALSRTEYPYVLTAYLIDPDQKLLKTPSISDPLLQQFGKYLAYRSHGLPKRLNEAFATFIKPLNRVLKSDSNIHCDEMIKHCHDVLLFTDIDLIRIQLTCRLYDRIDNFLGRKLYARDDKLITAVFFIVDYLYKFHQKAFDWDSLDKIDEIADIHRAPDLRDMTHEVVEAFGEMILHPVLNGMFAFRFKSSNAREIRYLSQLSPTESAAFNFTLDESQALKDVYKNKLANPNSATSALHASLGELHEYDQEYDAARKEYINAIEMIDLATAKTLDKKNSQNLGYLTIMALLEKARVNNGTHMISYLTDWVIFRLRLMLKIAMTFEHTRNYERAQAYYHEAQFFSRRVLQLIFGETPESFFKNQPIKMLNQQSSYTEPKAKIELTYFTAKNFNILYQAVFAKAWLAEKLGAGVDTSITIVKTELFYYENLFHHFHLGKPIEYYVEKSKQGNFIHASFGLIKSEFYNKAGDLCFFKGSNLPDSPHLNLEDTNILGYLYRATYYYATSLHYIRHFNVYRYEVSKKKYSALNSQQATFSPEQLPKYPLVEISSTLADISEVLLARISIKHLLQDLSKGKRNHPLPKNHKTQELRLNDTIPLFDFMITAKIYFDKWLKYGDQSYQKAAKDELAETYPSAKFIYSLWHNAEGKSLINADEFIDVWLGTRVEGPLSNVHSDAITSKQSTNCSIERIVCFVALANLSVSYQVHSGRIEEAAYHQRRAAISLIALLDAILLIKTQATHRGINLTKEVINWQSDPLQQFILYLINTCVYLIDSAASLYRENGIKKGDHKQKEKNVDFTPNELTLAAIKLTAIAIKSSIAWSNDCFTKHLRCGYQDNMKGDFMLDHTFSLRQLIENLVTKHQQTITHDKTLNITVLCCIFTYSNKADKNYTPDKWLPCLTLLLKQLCLVNRYPILNRLEMLQQMSLLGTQSKSDNRSMTSLLLLLDIKDCLYLLHNQNERAVKLLEALLVLNKYMEPKPIRKLKVIKQAKPWFDFKGTWKNEMLCIYHYAAISRLKRLNIMSIKAVFTEDFFKQKIVDIINDSELTKAIKVFCNDDKVNEAISNTKEMLEIEEQYNSPHHFTPTQVAHTCFQLADRLEKSAKLALAQILLLKQSHGDPQDPKIQPYKEIYNERQKQAYYFYLRANEYFYRNQQMYTLRHEYYKSIGDLYYLYDDFNDRYIHHAKALQVMTSSVSIAIEAEIKARLKILDQKAVKDPFNDRANGQ